jgi:ABC-2 type transport system permease protein/lipopolysaccharide transport system permease protein
MTALIGPDDEHVWVRTEDPPARPQPGERYRRDLTLLSALRELWLSREMVRSLTEREMRARYKQTFLGIAWAVVAPFLLMIVFTVFFTRAAHVHTEGAPYALFSYLGLLPWSFFSTSISQGGVSLVVNQPLLNKVYCPREVFPLACVCLAAIDMTIATSALLVLFGIERYAPQGTTAWVPLILLLQLTFTAAVAMITSAVTVYFRDLRTALPLALQLGLFATPVAYGLSTIPEGMRPLYAIVNPLASVIDAYRRTVLYGLAPNWGLFGLSALSTLVLLAGGYWWFKKMEGGIADVA